MAFQNFSKINVVVCASCQGAGCPECKFFGVYGVSGDNTLTFQLPPFLEIQKRKKAKIIFLIKRVALLLLSFILIFFIWKFINNF